MRDVAGLTSQRIHFRIATYEIENRFHPRRGSTALWLKRNEVIMRTRLICLFLLLFALATAGIAIAAEPPQPKLVASLQSGEQLPAAAVEPEDRTPKGPIQDNSFLVEEAYNQEDGIIQHISFFQRLANSKDWVYTFTDEWPLRTQKHQFSTTFAATHSGDFGGEGMGDTLINYRYQLIGSGETRVAMAPRLSLIVPSGDSVVGRGFGGTGLQTNLPVSIVISKKLVTHWNAGATWIPNAKNSAGDKAQVIAVNLGQSFIWQFSNRINGMLETVWTSGEDIVGRGKTVRNQDIFISPGVRWAYNFKSGLQIVPGVGVPIGVGPSSGEKGIIGYLSFEHPFAWSHSRPR
jgi:hypothetical protein